MFNADEYIDIKSINYPLKQHGNRNQTKETIAVQTTANTESPPPVPKTDRPKSIGGVRLVKVDDHARLGFHQWTKNQRQKNLP